MVRSLKKLLNGDDSPPPVIDLSNDKSKKTNAECSMRKHFEILSFADSSYSLKRGAGTISFVPDESNFNDNPFKSLLSHLELSLSLMLENNSRNHSYCTTKCTQIDQTIRTSLRIINNRCASLWRSDRESFLMQDSCLLYDDICFMIKNFDQLAISLKTFLVKRTGIASISSKLRSRELPHKIRLCEEVGFDLNSNIWAIYNQLSALVSDIFPSIIVRIETTIGFHLTNESKNIFSVYLKRDSFSKATSKRVDENKRIDSILIGILDKKLLDSVAIREHCSFFSITNIISVGLNSMLQSLLVFISHNRIRFNHEGVIVLYSLIIKVQNLLLSIKQELVESRRCSHTDTNFSIVGDKDPWLKLSIILGILQTGKISSTFISDNNGGNNGNKTKALNQRESFKMYSPISPEYNTSLVHHNPNTIHRLFKSFYSRDLEITPEVEEQKDNRYNVLASVIPSPSSDSNHETKDKRPVVDSMVKDVVNDRVNAYRDGNRDVINIKSRFILDSLGIFYCQSKKSNMLDNSVEIEHTNWIALAATRPNDIISCWPFPSIWNYRKNAKISSVSISVIVDLNNL
mmetsp:Transcript_26186/g.25025  ORF Transcript_26186/g.25025 Transcript_26186/m.25025 type:complete len:574 (+) Transcript_26186:227-1948(+)